VVLTGSDSVKTFHRRTNAECADIFVDLATHYIEAKHHQIHTLASPEQQNLFSQKFLESDYATNMLDLIINYSELYDTRGQYHSPYTALVQASMTGKS
jgi:hypothetical protein